MKGTILITDTLFIFPEHEQKLRDAGYEVERILKSVIPENELAQAVKGKIGYIMGGIEQVTDAVIDAADELKVIAFTGVDHTHWIPGADKATARGVAISNTPGANTFAVAEYTVAVILAMTRELFDLGRTGTAKFKTTRSLKELTVGIIGMGNIGSKVTQILHDMGAKEIVYNSRHQKPEIEKSAEARFMNMDEVLAVSDIVTLHASKEIGEGFVGRRELALMKDSSLIVNCGFIGAIDLGALYDELKSGRLRAAEDDAGDERLNNLPLSTWYASNAHTAYNTHEANKTASDMAVDSLLNLLATGEDQYRVN